MSDEQFTALDWRPSKKRASYPRVRAWGGQKKAPLNFLIAAAQSGFGKGPQKFCFCGRPAFREALACRFHGGALHAAKKRPYRKSPHREYRRKNND
jgi:hypothetical protein